ncbi:MAG: alpha/beta hydrolase [Gammaproteobacteria bacterium]
MYKPVVYFAHGKETGPEATKIRYLTELAKARGLGVESPDYTDLPDPDDRVQRLLVLASNTAGGLVLVGSSMGAYVSLVASAQLRPRGLYLLAPAIGLQGYALQEPPPYAGLTVAVHGWNDEIVAVENVIRYARRYAVELHLLNSDHRLLSVLPAVGRLFELFLESALK